MSLRRGMFGVFLVALIAAPAASWFFELGFFKPSSVRDDLLSGNYKGAYASALKDATDGDAIAANIVGNLYYLGLGVKRNYGQAARWYLTSALKGFAPAQANLGHLYSQGLGVPKDAVRMLGWYKMAKKSGYREIEDLLKRKVEENTFNANIIQKANVLFLNIADIKKNFSSEFKEILNPKR